MFVNLTPHALTIVKNDGSTIVLQPESTPARVKVTRHVVKTVNAIDLYSAEYGEVENLPEIKHGVYYIVSLLVKSAVPYRNDLVSPGDLVRDENGNVISCKGLTL